VFKKKFFPGILKINDENSRIRIQDPDPDPLVIGMDPRIRIRIHPKMPWIRNNAYSSLSSTVVKTLSVQSKYKRWVKIDNRLRIGHL
jgi:hypothetical protein